MTQYDNAEERDRLFGKVCDGWTLCSARNSTRKKDCPIYALRGEMNCYKYVRAHPETQKIMEDYLAAEESPVEPTCANCANWRQV